MSQSPALPDALELGQRCIRAFTQVVPATLCAFYRIDAQLQAQHFSLHRMTPHMHDAYLQRYRHYDPLRPRNCAAAGRPVLSLHMGMAQQGRHETEVYQGFLQRNGVCDVVEILASDGQRVRGSLGAFFCAPPNTSRVLADFDVESTHGGGKRSTQAYRGDLIRWQSPTTSVIARYRQPLLPDLQVTVELLDPYTPNSSNALSAQVSFYYATELIDRYTVMATATPVTLRTSSVGPVRIQGGALSFRPATQEQQGQLSLDGTFQSGQNPPNHYVGSIADWSWIRGRADNCRG